MRKTSRVHVRRLYRVSGLGSSWSRASEMVSTRKCVFHEVLENIPSMQQPISQQR